MITSNTNVLAHLADEQFDASVLNRACYSVGFGPISLEACVTLVPPSASVALKVLGNVVAACELSNLHPTCTIGGSFAGFRAEVELTLDIPGKKLKYKLTGCLPIVGCATHEGSFPL